MKSLENAVKAAILYALAVFAAGFALGVVRTFALAPRFGETTAVFLELPFMLAISWFVCGAVLRGVGVAASPPARLLMGGLAFAILLACEAALGLGLMRLSASDWLARFSTPSGAAGLGAQLAFAAFPALRR